MHSLEDKEWWCAAGEDKERAFVEQVLPLLGFSGEINPAKQEDRFAPDLVVNGHLADLKSQRTPFFKAQELFGVDPQFAVSFNDKDYRRYAEHYPELDIYYWVVWQTTTRRIGSKERSVKPMAGVWRATFAAMRYRIEHESVRSHTFLHRLLDGPGNGKSSYMFDVRKFEFLGGSSVARDAVLWANDDELGATDKTPATV
ncbi:MAG TPA: hypothetical protein VGH52_04155 [Gaiellaceae bacterium]